MLYLKDARCIFIHQNSLQYPTSGFSSTSLCVKSKDLEKRHVPQPPGYLTVPDVISIQAAVPLLEAVCIAAPEPTTQLQSQFKEHPNSPVRLNKAGIVYFPSLFEMVIQH